MITLELSEPNPRGGQHLESDQRFTYPAHQHIRR